MENVNTEFTDKCRTDNFTPPRLSPCPSPRPQLLRYKSESTVLQQQQRANGSNQSMCSELDMLYKPNVMPFGVHVQLQPTGSLAYFSSGGAEFDSSDEGGSGSCGYENKESHVRAVPSLAEARNGMGFFAPNRCPVPCFRGLPARWT